MIQNGVGCIDICCCMGTEVETCICACSEQERVGIYSSYHIEVCKRAICEDRCAVQSY